MGNTYDHDQPNPMKSNCNCLHMCLCSNYICLKHSGSMILLTCFIIVTICKEDCNCYKKGIAAQCKNKSEMHFVYSRQILSIEPLQSKLRNCEIIGNKIKFREAVIKNIQVDRAM